MINERMSYMSVNIFSDADIKILSKNKYIKNVSHKGITYTDDFKRLFVAEQEKGKFVFFR